MPKSPKRGCVLYRPGERLLCSARARIRLLVESGALYAATYPGNSRGIQFDRECLRRVGRLLAALTTGAKLVACPEGPAGHFLAAAIMQAKGPMPLRGLVVRFADKARPTAHRVLGPPTRPGEKVLLFAVVADSGQSLVQAAEVLREERKLDVRRVVALLGFAPAEEEMRKAGLHFLTVHRLNGELEAAGEGQAWRDLKAEYQGKPGFCGPLDSDVPHGPPLTLREPGTRSGG